jgi:polysaccharide export outer membrane protein
MIKFTVLVALLCYAGLSGVVSRASGADTDYLLQPRDLLQVEVYGQPDLAREVRISLSETINLPLIGLVSTEHKTISQLIDDVRIKYNADYLVNPHVNIRVLEFAKRTVNVIGAVTTSGAVEFPVEGELRLMDAITKAGGFTRLSNRHHIVVTRGDVAHQQTFTIDAVPILEGNQTWNIQLETGDTVFIAENLF